MQHKRGNRIVFYLNDEEADRLEQVVADSDLPRADYLREVLDGVFTGALASTDGITDGVPREAQAQIHGLEQLITQMRERQGMSDSLNQELSQRLQGGSCNFGPPDAYAAVAVEQRTSPLVACLVI